MKRRTDQTLSVTQSSSKPKLIWHGASVGGILDSCRARGWTRRCVTRGKKSPLVRNFDPRPGQVGIELGDSRGHARSACPKVLLENHSVLIDLEGHDPG